MIYYDPVVPIRNRLNLDVYDLFYLRSSTLEQLHINLFGEIFVLESYDRVEPIRNRKNFTKYAFYYFEPCASAFLQAYRWLYDRAGPPEHIINQYDSSPKDTKKRFNFNKGDISKLEGMKMNPDKIKQFDVTLLYKLIQHGTDNDQLASLYNGWSKESPPADKSNLAYLLFLVKESRNEVGHVEDCLKDLTDNDVADECTKLIGRLSSIIQQCGEMAKIDQSDIDEVKNGLKDDLERIRDEEEEDQLTSLFS